MEQDGFGKHPRGAEGMQDGVFKSGHLGTSHPPDALVASANSYRAPQASFRTSRRRLGKMPAAKGY